MENKTITLSDQINFGNQWPDNYLSGQSQPFYPSTASSGDEKKEKNSPQTQNIIQYNAQTVNFVQYMPPSGFEASPATDKKNYNQANYLRQM